MPGIESLIVSLRPDLCKRFGFDQPENQQAFLSWLVTSGTREYMALATDRGFLAKVQGSAPGSRLTRLQACVWQARADVQKAFARPDQHLEFLQWFYTHAVGEHVLWPFLTPKERQTVVRMEGPWQTALLERAVTELVQEAPTPIAQRSWGVNLIGYAYGQLGIGEDARMAARALLAAKVPMTMLNFAPGAHIPQNDRSMAEHVSEDGPHAFNLFCMTAEENGRFYAERGPEQFANRYNIGYWPWELGQWPSSWQKMLDLVDEVWVSTQHTYDALVPVCSKPLWLMPMAVELGPIARFSSRKKARAHFGLPPDAILFCFAFDLNSSVHRKNPQAAVDAFLAAFPAMGSRGAVDAVPVGLVIKVHTPTRRNATWEKLKQLAAQDPRIHIIEGTLTRPDLLALYQACDCFVSLHRAEGFGRGLAEAMQLGLHVIATGYSGNVDFCQPPHADLVRYRLTKVRKGHYPNSQGQVWATADVAHAAELMRRFALRSPKGTKQADWPAFSAAVVGARYRARLEAIYQKEKTHVAT